MFMKEDDALVLDKLNFKYCWDTMREQSMTFRITSISIIALSQNSHGMLLLVVSLDCQLGQFDWIDRHPRDQ